MGNHLYYGDNLEVLQRSIAAESVDLIYLDPPFNSNATYNVLFKAPGGQQSQAQIEAFEDTWHWNETAEQAFDEVMASGNSDAAEMLRALRAFLGINDMMAYLTMMAVRLIELHRVLKPTGSLYLHCDPTASHYLKIVLDAVFGVRNFLNEIIWQRTSAHSSAHRYGPIHDVIFYYAKSDDYCWTGATQPYNQDYIEAFFVHQDADGRRWQRADLTGAGVRKGDSGKPWRGIDVTAKKRHWAVPHDELDRLDALGRLHWPAREGGVPQRKRYIDELPGMPLQDVITDIKPIHNISRERLGYPTQKPVALLERIVAASSSPGDVVLDPFCGCGTTIHAAEKLGRRWIGIDVTHLAISLIENRLNDAFPGIEYEVHGTPKDLDGARALAARDKYQFQWWAVSLVKAVPYRGQKKGADGGVDGLICFKPDGRTTERAIVSVKGGAGVGVAVIRELMSVVEQQNAKIGLLISLAEPTPAMRSEAAAAGAYTTDFGSYPKIQILTIGELLAGFRPQIPLVDTAAFRKALREEGVQFQMNL
ncbi:MAG: restriction endonuclease [Rhodospirillales bacterium]|jgi:site-specific DNA-methyltransferase (adenine-specific)|nr:restriction endonuclease [Rhodospirillales bacterium]